MQNTHPCLHSQGMALLEPFRLIAITGVPGEGVPGATLSLKRATNGCSRRAAHVGRSEGVCLRHALTKSMPSAPSPGGGAGMVLFDPTWNSAAMGSRFEFGGVVFAISNTVHPACRQAHGGCKLYEGLFEKVHRHDKRNLLIRHARSVAVNVGRRSSGGRTRGWPCDSRPTTVLNKTAHKWSI